MVGWHYRLDGHEFDQAPGVVKGQGSLVCLQSMGSQRIGHDRATELPDVLCNSMLSLNIYAPVM